MKSVVTRDFSRNPSGTLRNAQEGPVVITKYGRPVGVVASIEYWDGLLKQAKERYSDEVDTQTMSQAAQTPVWPPLGAGDRAHD